MYKKKSGSFLGGIGLVVERMFKVKVYSMRYEEECVLHHVFAKWNLKP